MENKLKLRSNETMCFEEKSPNLNQSTVLHLHLTRML